MASERIRTEAPRRGRDSVLEPVVSTDRDALATCEEDAARSRGTASGLARPRDEAEIAALLGRARRLGAAVLAQGARSSLTAGATPRGDLVLALDGLDRVLAVGREARGGWARVEPGVRLRDLNERLAPEGLWFPPVPTYDLCCVGGAVSTNAAGAATWKHGAVRPWVRALRVVLASGEVLALRRGEVTASPRGFEIESASGVTQVPLPRYRTPLQKKIACGYFVRDGLDLVDIFIGAEGTLGVVSEIELALSPLPAAVVAGVASFPGEARALAFAAAVRAASEETWRTGDPAGLDMRALELVDAASLELLRDGKKDLVGMALPAPGGCFVLWEQELAAPVEDDAAATAIGEGLAGSPGRGPLRALGAFLAAHGAGEDARVALPHDDRGRRLIAGIREAVPEAVNDLIALRKRTDPGVRKVAGDMVVPFERLPEMLAHYRERFARRGLACAIWGHLSDGNLHPNVLSRTAADTRSGEEALLELGDLARELGGAPLSEHGVGKSPTKQELLRRFYGDEALDDMVRVKLALDPGGMLAPGNIFSRERLSRIQAGPT